MAGQIGMKFGMEVVLEGGRFLGGGLTRYPPGTGCIKGVLGASGASTMHLAKTLKNKSCSECSQ